MNRSHDYRRTAFLVLCAACIAAIVIYGIVSVRSHRASAPAESPRSPAAETATPSPAPQPPAAPQEHPATSAAPAPESPSGPAKTTPKAEVKPALLYFEANALGPNYGKLAVAPLNDLEQRQYAADLYCDRVHFSGGHGICLHADRGSITSYYAVGFNDQMQRTWSFKLPGVPSRARVSPSGKLGAITVFIAGQSYTSLNFETQTMILNAATGEILVPNLEVLAVTRDGAEFKSKDFNFWGVTFAQDENRFYATLWSKGNTYLIESDLAKRTARVIHDNVECPGLSPDNTRVAFKKRSIGGLLEGRRITWRITVLDLKTMTETPLGETRTVDDQVEWLDNGHILYALSDNEKGASATTNIWVLPATADGKPQILLKGGFSPAVARSSVPATQR